MKIKEMDIVANMQQLRQLLGISRKDMAEAAGISYRQLSSYERGQCDWDNMPVCTAALIEKWLGCRLADFGDLDILGSLCDSSEDVCLDASAITAAVKAQMVAKALQLDSADATFLKAWRKIPVAVVRNEPVSELTKLQRAMLKI